jgi:hypothetical protein
MIKKLAGDSKIPWKEVQQNVKMMELLKSILLEDLPEG